MRAYDLSPLFRSTIGFDRLSRLMESAVNEGDAPSYPPYNIEKLGDNDYRITMAVAGFAEADLDVTAQENVLTIKGRQGDDRQNAKYLHRGIASRAFERRFQLADHIKVGGAKLENGLLHVDLAREVPEAMKPRTIQISSAGQRTLEQKAA